MKILVYEHVSGGGYAEQLLPTEALAEGFAMLRCLVADLRAAGHQVTVLLDSRLFKLDPPIEATYTSQVLYINEPKKLLINLAKNNDAIYIIAPETGQTLQSYVELIEKTEKVSLNSQSIMIAKAANKIALYDGLQKNGYPIPKSFILNVTNSITQIETAITGQLTYPVIFKPVDGVGCSGISLIENATDINCGVAKIKSVSANPNFIAQEKVEGEPVSVSLLSNGKKAVALTLNRQQITLAKSADSCYNGGCIPFEHPKKQEALTLSERIVETLNLRGYAGVDLILGERALFVLDVNARLTTSYVGLRQVVDFNVAQALIDAVVTEQLPKKASTLGVTCFSKTHIAPLTSGVYRKTTRIAGVMAPPFPLSTGNQNTVLVMGYGNSIQNAHAHLEEVKNTLHRCINR
ncbi:ATP-grasp domain-containing protein [Candidatus Bathycorpusculum sp.]|uniref:ATP-grasp domain-containing protein n=1 Tax=Candidatus Bathycorpusculum sp. TaxID=2994959 RepID=UPI00282E4726|nr:ATP-grasp domain-containing protein [Candidatus Termitimicrobium sp.]MCL2432555.1 ATP-grasp domain-containing protein [Candidatus Termitimicrobium sp.]